MITKNFNNSSKSAKFTSSLANTMFLLNSIHCCIDFSSKYYSKAIYVDRFFWVKPFLYSLLDLPNNNFYIIDGAQFRHKQFHLVIQFNCNTMTNSNHLNFFSMLPLNSLVVISISSLFNSSTWLERELSEFTGIIFLGLLDTRRLLLDYFESKHVWQTHIGNDKSYNSNLYDITLNF